MNLRTYEIRALFNRIAECPSNEYSLWLAYLLGIGYPSRPGLMGMFGIIIMVIENELSSAGVYNKV